MSLDTVPSRLAPVLEKSGRFVTNWHRWFENIFLLFKSGYTGSVVIPPLTVPGGTQGSLTVTNGIITSYTPPT